MNLSVWWNHFIIISNASHVLFYRIEPGPQVFSHDGIK